MFEKSIYLANLKQIIITLSDIKFDESFVMALVRATFSVNLIPLRHAVLV